MAKVEGEFSFSDLNKEMKKLSSFGGIVSEGCVSDITEYIPVGNYICNATLTGSLFQGIPNNRICSISGDPSTGKTYLCLNIAREAQQKGYYVYWFDTENTTDANQFKKFGIDLDRIIYSPVGTVMEFKTTVTNVLNTLISKKESGMKIPKILFVLDSLGMLASEKEYNDALQGEDKVDLTRPKQLRSIFRIITQKLGIIGGTFIYTNHVYQTTDMYSQTKQNGGLGGIYSASIILNLSKAKLKEGSDNTQTGIIVTAKPDKNRFVVPHTVKFYISYVNGMNPFVGLEEYISWDRCGIDRGKIIDEKEYNKSPNEKYKRIECKDGTIKYFVPSDSGRNVCCDDGSSYPWKKLFTPQVFTKERLERLDKYIQEEFKYADGVQVNDLFEGDIDNEESEIVEQSSDDMIKNQLFD